QAALALATDFDVAYSLALADLELKKVSLATVLFDEMKNSLPESAQLHILIGRALLATGYPQLATKEFEHATTLDSRYPQVHFYLALAYLFSAQAPAVLLWPVPSGPRQAGHRAAARPTARPAPSKTRRAAILNLTCCGPL